MDNVRVRFAPSPTGPLHIGGVRTALYNYLFAKKHGGTFILRIEDTDQKRYVEGAEEYIMEALEWFGLELDESPKVGGDFGPYRQSERKDIYQKYAEELVAKGHAYYAFDSSDELTKMREDMEAKGVHSAKYNAETRGMMKNSFTLSAEEVEQLKAEGTNMVIRLDIPRDRDITFTDEVRGEVTFSSNELDDKVIMKADGLPTYHLANIVDDHLMEISHVIRGEEWLSSTAHHVLMYDFFGWEAPSFAHLPLILKPTGKGKLSKRDGAKFGFPVFPLKWEGEDETYAGFREDGYLPDAVINFLAFLGWNPGTEQEIFSLEELVKAFSLEHIVKSGARFDVDKSRWYNQQYIIHKDNDALVSLLKPMAKEKGIEVSDDYLKKFVELMKERVTLVPDFFENGAFFFSDPTTFDEKNAKKKYQVENRIHFDSIIGDLTLMNHKEFKAEAVHDKVVDYIKDKELSMGRIMPILRIALCGTMKGPDLFASMELLGRDESLQRLSAGVAIIEHAAVSN